MFHLHLSISCCVLCSMRSLSPRDFFVHTADDNMKSVHMLHHYSLYHNYWDASSHSYIKFHARIIIVFLLSNIIITTVLTLHPIFIKKNRLLSLTLRKSLFNLMQMDTKNVNSSTPDIIAGIFSIKVWVLRPATLYHFSHIAIRLIEWCCYRRM